MIAIDTNILIWGLDRQATAGLESMIPLAERFFAYVTAEKIPLCIPSQALAEFLVRNTEEERQAALAQIDASFPIASLDFAAGYLASDLTSDRDHLKSVRATFGVTRQVVKADVNIIASALVFGATRLITGNLGEMRALAKGRIIVDSLDEYVTKYIDQPASSLNKNATSSNQMSLFGDEAVASIATNGKSIDAWPLAFNRCDSCHPLIRPNHLVVNHIQWGPTVRP